MANKTKFGFGSSSAVLQAIQDGKINARDFLALDENTSNPKFGWVNLNNEPVILDTEKVIVIEGESLPETGVSGKIYIFGEDGYFWNGQKFINLCKPTDVTELEDSIKALEELAVKIADDTKNYTDGKVKEVLDEVGHSYEKIKYEITSVPVGTLIDYREDEIRIMCPKDTVFTKQSVGVGGNPNSYYMTFKTYYPSEDVVGYIEHLGDMVDPEILTKSSTDKYGRVYQTTWLALADYDESSDTWTYRGASSSKDGYYGYDYQIDWYDANGVMIASDSIRINLSNENCHSVNEPYYVGSIMKEVDTKIEEKIAEVEAAYEIVEF